MALSKTTNDFCYDIKRANKVPDNYIAKGQPHEKFCLSCKKRLRPTEQLNGFCKACKEQFEK